MVPHHDGKEAVLRGFSRRSSPGSGARTEVRRPLLGPPLRKWQGETTEYFDRQLVTMALGPPDAP